ncbi:site-specific integrase [Stutzerimonas nitrititolerans]|uniref:site-specific integrase n=1 Tax=Stutzerimonas nitrititolerans TaxID=2482751 RepID=UPI002896F7FD|nr:site-specific integrase [Stutzerimonas nitrititolerans]
MSVSRLFQRYVDALSVSDRQAHVLRRHEADYGRAVKRFIEIVGDIRVSAITGSDIHTFASQLLQPPSPTTKPLAFSSAQLVVARFSSILSFAVEIGEIISNPGSKTRLTKRLRTTGQPRQFESDKGYSRAELVTLFSHTEFKTYRFSTGRPGNAVFWLPLIAAYTGMRREEIAQLYVSDFVSDPDGSWLIRVNDDRPDKSVKSKHSRREVPVHSDLIKLGILGLRNSQTPNERVFPELIKAKDGFAGIVSKAWRTFTQRAGIYRAGRHPLHAFRHTFKTLARVHGIPKEVSDWITGHAPANVGDTYGIRPRARMSQEIEKIPSLIADAEIPNDLIL